MFRKSMLTINRKWSCCVLFVITQHNRWQKKLREKNQRRVHEAKRTPFYNLPYNAIRCLQVVGLQPWRQKLLRRPDQRGEVQASDVQCRQSVNKFTLKTFYGTFLLHAWVKTKNMYLLYMPTVGVFEWWIRTTERDSYCETLPPIRNH